MKKYTHISLFAGLGGFIIAGNRAGFSTALANEIDLAACTTLQYNFPNISLFTRDVKEFSPRDFSELEIDIDVLSAGFPCQSFSIAGNNLGFDDPRGKLFFEIPRICKEMNSPPKVLLLENVPNLKHFEGGSRLDLVITELRKAGYWVSFENAQILDSKVMCDTVQKRERLYIVAVHSKYFKRNKFKFPAPLNVKRRSLWDFIDRELKEDERLYLDEENKYARMIRKNANEHGSDRLFQIRRFDARSCSPNTCPTLTANMGGGGHNVPFVIDNHGVRKLSISELKNLQSIRNDELFFPKSISNSDALSMIGNAVCIDVVELLFKSIKETILEANVNEKILAFS